MNPADTEPARLVGFTGKIPACGDFVRQHVGNKVSSELERWLSASSQNLYHGKHDLGAARIRFVFSAAGCEDVAVGSLVKSQDRVGRSYPLAIFTSLSASDAMAQLAALPAAYEPFFVSAEAVLERASDLPLESLRERVASLSAPTAGQQLAAAQASAQKLDASDAAAALRSALSDQPEPAVYYALLTLCTATGAVLLGPASGPPTVLDCPVSGELGPSLWLALTAARLRWTQGALSLLWTAAEAPRLLLALGYASDQLLTFSATKLHQSTRLWPLTTERPEAIERARVLLEPKLGPLRVVDAREPNLLSPSLTQLAAQLTHVSC
jgi:type VI secretion system protein ImpM